jgi:hypothetical protein
LTRREKDEIKDKNTYGEKKSRIAAKVKEEIKDKSTYIEKKSTIAAKVKRGDKIRVHKEKKIKNQ